MCSNSDEDALDDVQMIICLSSVTPSIIGNRVDYALQEGGKGMVSVKQYLFIIIAEQRLSVMLQPPTKMVKMSEEEQSLFFHSLSSALNCKERSVVASG